MELGQLTEDEVRLLASCLYEGFSEGIVHQGNQIAFDRLQARLASLGAKYNLWSEVGE